MNSNKEKESEASQSKKSVKISLKESVNKGAINSKKSGESE